MAGHEVKKVINLDPYHNLHVISCGADADWEPNPLYASRAQRVFKTPQVNNILFTTFPSHNINKAMAPHEEDEDLIDEELPTCEPYNVLGIEKTATTDEIKSAYRKAALQHHPGKVNPTPATSPPN